jgi:hypothetical protein
MKSRKNFLFVIGIDKYSSDHDDLKNAVYDTERVKNILVERYGFELIEEPLLNEHATRSNIIEALNRLANLVTEEDNLLIYHAGHGIMNARTSKGFWIPSDAQKQVSDYIPNSTVKDAIESIKAKHIFLVSDSCFSGTFLSTRSSGTERHFSKLDEIKSRWVLTSGRLEKVSDGEPGKGSPFANYFIKKLSENKNKFLSVSELIEFVSISTGSSSSQQPIGAHIENVGHEGGQMVLTLKAEYVKETSEAIAPADSSADVSGKERDSDERTDDLNKISAGKEVLLVKSFLKDADYLLIELFRFDDNGEKRFEFSENKVRALNGAHPDWELIRRFATHGGVQRYLDESKHLYDKFKMLLIPAAEDIANVEVSESAIRHREKLKILLKQNKSRMNCLHCQKKISTNDSLFVEIDEKNLNPTVGNVHKECLRPADRILGKTIYENLTGDSAVINFDYEKWFALFEGGQGFINAAKRMKTSVSLPVISWNPDHSFNFGTYCIKMNLKDGSSSYVHLGKDVQKFEEGNIDKEVDFFNDSLQKGIKDSDPLSITSKKKMFGVYSELLKIKEEDETILEIESFEKAKYSAQFSQINKSIKNDYAPLCLVIDPRTEKIVNLSNLIPIISDPFNFDVIHENWKAAVFDLGKCELRIIESDHELDNYLRSFFDDGMQPILDPLFDKKGKLLKGHYIADFKRLISDGVEHGSIPTSQEWKKGEIVQVVFPGMEQLEKKPTGVLLEGEFFDESGESCAIFQPIEDGVEMDLMYKIPTKYLQHKMI